MHSPAWGILAPIAMSASCLLASSPFAPWTVTSRPRHAAASGGNVEYRPVPALTHSLVQWPSLHVVEHDENACFSAGAFLISAADTYGYSPHSRKLGHWCSRANLMNAGAFVFQSAGEPFKLL